MQMTIPFFLKSTTELIKMFDKFPLFSGLKTNNTRCEVAGIGVRKGVKMALYGMECMNLTEDVITVLLIYFSYNKKLN